MQTQQYVALLRGINVGDRNSVAMADLRQAFEADEYTAVSTYRYHSDAIFLKLPPSGEQAMRVVTCGKVSTRRGRVTA